MDLAQLLERDEVLDALSALVAGASDDGGRLVLLAGEAGIGKTSVVQRLAGRWDHRAVVLVGACDPLDTPRPLSPLLDIAADASSGITELVAGGVTGPELFAALVERISGTARPTLLVIEDVHWADAATLDFLRYVGRRVERTNAVVVATYRDDELAVHEELRRLLGDLATRGDMVVRISLETLSVDAVAQLAKRAGASSAEAASLHTSTGGNPFYVTEVLASGGGLPATVQDAVMARVLRLDPESRAVVEMVAVAPRSLDPGVGAGGSLTMVAVEYIVPNSPEVAADPPMLFDRHFHLNTDLDVWVLHAWVWKKNPHRDVRGLQPEGRRLPLT